MRSPLREAVRGLEPAVHGGSTDARVLDFSTGINPFPPPRAVRKAARRALRGATVSRYPDTNARELRGKLARLHGCPEQSVVVCNGTSQGLWLLALTCLGPGTSSLTFRPTYADYSTVTRMMGAREISVALEAKDGFRLEGALQQAIDLIHRERPRLVWLTNPGNPTGVYQRHETVSVLAQAAARAGGMLVLDEAYLWAVEDAWDSLDMLDHGGIVVLRSMTKDFAIPALRLGYIIAAPELARTVAAVRPPWSINAAAQAAGVAALSMLPWYRRRWARVRELARELAARIEKLGLEVLPSQGNFFLVRCPADRQLPRRLAERGLRVRDCTSFDLPDFIRVGTGTEPENRRLVRTLSRLLEERPWEV